MATRTVRLDDDAEFTLKEVQTATGLPISEILKRGLFALRDEVHRASLRTPIDVFRELDLGPGGYARARATDAKKAVRDVVKKKLHR